MKGAGQNLSPQKQTNWFTQSSLRHSFRPDECLICSHLIASEWRAIHPFIYEGIMAPGPRNHFLRGGGFCLLHFWIAKRIEEECWPEGGIGVAILCENHGQEIPSGLPTFWNRNRGPSFRRLRCNPKTDSLHSPGFDCTFCRDNQESEASLLREIEHLLDEKDWFRMLRDAPLRFRHT
jgi:hypothetical protein